MSGAMFTIGRTESTGEQAGECQKQWRGPDHVTHLEAYHVY